MPTSRASTPPASLGWTTDETHEGTRSGHEVEVIDVEPVVDENGTVYVPIERSGSAWLVRDPRTGEHRRIDPDRLERAPDVSPLEAAADGVDPAVRRLLALVHDDRSLGLLIELADRGPLPVRTVLSAYDFCESDLHGRLVTWRTGGLIAETDVGGERGYRLTEAGARAIRTLRATTADAAGDGVDES